jgi:tRNA G26 N,N-dimethylase Trm1
MNKFKLLVKSLFQKQMLPSDYYVKSLITTDNAKSKQLIQSCVVEAVCKHCANKLCDSQTFNQQCFNCGKKPL